MSATPRNAVACPLSWCSGDPDDHGHNVNAPDVLAGRIVPDDPSTWVHVSPTDALIPGLTGALWQRGNEPVTYGLVPDFLPEAAHDSTFLHGLAKLFTEAAHTLRTRALPMLTPEAVTAPSSRTSRDLTQPAELAADPLATEPLGPGDFTECPMSWCSGLKASHLPHVGADMFRHESTPRPLFPGMVGYLASWGEELPRYVVEYHYQPLRELDALGVLETVHVLARSALHLTEMQDTLAELERGPR